MKGSKCGRSEGKGMGVLWLGISGSRDQGSRWWSLRVAGSGK